MADYHPLIAHAVAGLENNTGEARRELYERARSALVKQLRGVTPALGESEITRERLALEEAIRKVEAEQARRSRQERLQAAAKAMPSQPQRGEGAPVEPKPVEAAPVEPKPVEAAPGALKPADTAPAETQIPPSSSMPAQDLKAPEGPSPVPTPEQPKSASAASGSGVPQADRDVTPPESKRSVPDPKQLAASLAELERLSFPHAPTARPPEGSPEPERPESAASTEGDAATRAPSPLPLDQDFFAGAPAPAPELPEAVANRRLRLSPEPSGEAAPPQPAPVYEAGSREQATKDARTAAVAAAAGGDSDELPEVSPDVSRQLRSGSTARIIITLVVLAVLGAVAAAGYRQRDKLVEFYQTLRGPSTQTPQKQARPQPKIEDRVATNPADRVPGADRRREQAPVVQPPPAVAQRVVLYEEDPNDPNGKRFVGSVIWRTETVSPGAGLAPELAVKATIEVPERHLTMNFSMVRNTDPALPASHTIDIRFKVPPDFSGGGVANVPGVLMKQAEQARGVPLAGLAVKVTNNVFLIGLSSVETDVQRNTQLLKERPWFDIPIVYSNGSRAILAMEKGTPGERAFNDAFTAWGKAGTAAR